LPGDISGNHTASAGTKQLMIAPNGVPCCDISDGHRTEYDFRALAN
jgi:hypothetical protein